MESQVWRPCCWGWCQPERISQFQQWALPSEGSPWWSCWATWCCQEGEQESCWWNQRSSWPAWRWRTLNPWTRQTTTSSWGWEGGTPRSSWRGWSCSRTRRKQGSSLTIGAWTSQTRDWSQDSGEGRGIQQYTVTRINPSNHSKVSNRDKFWALKVTGPCPRYKNSTFKYYTLF